MRKYLSTTVRITERHDAMVKALSKVLKKPQAEILRMAIDAILLKRKAVK